MSKINMEVTFKQAPNVCRGCLATERKMVNATLFDTMFRNLAGITISPSDGLPQSLCYECTDLLQKYYRFRNKVIKSYHLLHQFVNLGIQFSYEKNASPHLTRTSIDCYEIPGAQAEQIAEQTNPDEGEVKTNFYVIVDDINAPVVIKSESDNVKFESGDEDNITIEECDLYFRARAGLVTQGMDAVDTITSKESESEQIAVKSGINECSSDVTGRDELLNNEIVKQIVKQTNPDEDEVKTNVIVNDIDAPVVIKTESDNVKFESGDEDNITIEECDLYQGTNAVDTTTSKVNESEQVAVNCGINECSSDVTGRDELLDNDIVVKLEPIDDNTNAISPHSNARDENIKETVNSVSSSSRNKLQTYVCDTCRRCFEKKKQLIAHILQYATQELNRCDDCGKRYNHRHYCLNIYNRKQIMYECDICLKCFRFRYDFIRHCRTHTREKPYNCNICMKSYTAKSNLKGHYRIHTNETPYKCDVCEKQFRVKNALTKHYRSHSDGKPVQCSICMNMFSSRSDFKKHCCNKHPVSLSDQVPVNNLTNRSSFTSDKHRVYYVETSNKQTEQLEIVNSKEKKSAVDDTGTPLNIKALIVNGKAQIVGEDKRIENKDAYVRERDGLATHGMDAVDTSVNSSACNHEQSYTCDSCNISFKKKELLIYHIQTLKCDVRMKCFSDTNQYRIHTSEMPYQCNKSMRTLKFNCLLNRNQLTYTNNNRRYQCEVCKKDFKDRRYLAVHYRIHTGEKPYQCDVCMRSFSQKCTLTTHYRLHTGEKPYECDVCEKTFRSKTNLRKHSSLHDKNPYKCDLCTRCFKVESDLTIHQRYYHCEYSTESH